MIRSTVGVREKMNTSAVRADNVRGTARRAFRGGDFLPDVVKNALPRFGGSVARGVGEG